MPRKIVLSTLAISLFSVILLQASTYSVSAETPATSPATFFNLVGKVTYKQLGRLLGNTERLTPAPNVKIEVEGFFDRSKKYEVMTDANGNYTLNVPAGLYTVEVNDNSSSKTDFFTPPFRVERVREHGSSTVNFQGLVF